MSFTNLMRALGALALVLVFSTATMAQGVTTSSMRGKVLDTTGEPLIGANVLAVHQPSGTVYGTATDLEGNYRIPNMRVGGPYKVTVTYTGYAELSAEGINLRLGEAFRRDYNLEEGGIQLETIQVIARQGTAGANSGASTQITSEAIENVPTLNRDLSDYVRLTPQASGFGGGTSFAGVNNRYNAIYVDGAVNNDVFGLASSGTNGGQTGIAPFSIDIIDQLQVVLSPYDVTYGGFAGGGVNAVTKSGTNNFEGTAYYFLQNESMVGKTNQSLTDRTGSEREGVDEFTQTTYGASLGGPIVKDKIFFFANAEIRADETPQPFDFGQYDGDATQDDLNTLRNFVRDNYGYDPGTFGDVTDNLDGLKLFGKLDFNLSDDHRLTLRHNYVRAEELNRNTGGARNIEFSNNGVFFPSVTNSSALELNSSFGSKFSNNLIIGYTAVRDDRDPIGGDFPYVIIGDGEGVLEFGSEQFSTGNALDQDILTITDNFKIYNNNHTITIGTHNEFYSIYNLFIRQNYGVYEYDNLDAFYNDSGAAEYDRSYSLVDDITGDGSAAAAEFNAMQLGFYVQDEWTVTPQFTLTGGLRFDLPIITTDPNIHPSFNTETLPELEQAYDVAENITGGQAPDGQLMISPRLGFNYDLTGDRSSVLRGGLGIFTSRIPFVWPGAMFNNNGVTLGGVDAGDLEGPIEFIPDIQRQYTNENFSVPSGQVDLFTEDFRYPQVLRGNLAVDTELPGGILATFEGVYTKTLNNVLYTNVNSDPTVDFNWSGADNRAIYTRDDIDERYSAIYVASNTNEGYTYTLTASLAKAFDFGLTANVSYTYGDAEAINEGTSSQNSSQWRGQVGINGRNNPVLGRSDFALGHRVLGTLNYTFDWNKEKNASTSITLLYEGQKGSPYSYVIGGRSARNINNETGSTSRNRSLIYIPASQNEITLVEADGISPQEQWNRLNAFIEDDPHLSENRGGYAEKNSNFLPFTSFLDLSVRQDFGVNVGGKNHKMQLSWDVFNLANLINPSWGVRYNVPGSFNYYELYTFEGYAEDGTTPTFSYTEEGLNTDALNISNFSSRWRMRLGLRYIFN